MQKNSKWTEDECDIAIREVANMAREFHHEGYLNLHAVSQVCFELACQRNALKIILDRLTAICFEEKDILAKEVFQHRGLASLATEARELSERIGGRGNG